MKAVIFILFLISTGCASKTLVKNCEPTVTSNYFVCDSLVFGK